MRRMHLRYFCLFLFLVSLPTTIGQQSKIHSRKITFRNGRGTIALDSDAKSKKISRDEDFRISTGIDLVLGGLTQAQPRRDEGQKEGKISKGRISQRLDHFDGMNAKRWNQTYWVNDKFHEKGGPVFLFLTSGAIENDLYWIGDEDEHPDWIVKAKKFKALCFLLEHRYYGESRPTKSLYVTSMRFLNTYQALGDIAYFISNITTEYQLGKAPWVLFGCSYAGALAIWSKLKFPHLVSIAVSSGAPLEAKLDFSEYAEMVTKSLKAENVACVESIRNATKSIESWLVDASKFMKLKKLFRFCEDLDPKDKKNVSVFFAQLAENIFNIVQGSKINRGVAKNNLTTTMICSTMANVSLGDYISRYASIHRRFFAYHSVDCFSTSYFHLIEQLKDERYQIDNWRQWTYQACNEFGFYTTSNSPYQPFGHQFDLEYYMNQCTDAFGLEMSKRMAISNIDETLRQYGGRYPKIDKIIFTYGTADPWCPLGPTESFGSVKVIPIKGASHCADFYAPDDTSDSKALKMARRQVDTLLEKWLRNGSPYQRYRAFVIFTSAISFFIKHSYGLFILD